MRTAEISRKTKETDVYVKLNLDGEGIADIATGIGFFDHMLTSFATHSGIDLTLKIKGDLEVDCHHTVEDAGIALGKAVKEAFGDKKGIVRFADCFIPMDESLAFASVDVSGRGLSVFTSDFTFNRCGDYETPSTEEFMRSLASNAEITLHIRKIYGSNDHHVTEALFKSLAIALKKAKAVVGDKIPSSKGAL